jgi:germination protein M
VALKCRRMAAIICILAILAIMGSGCGLMKDLVTGEASNPEETGAQTDSELAPEGPGLEASQGEGAMITDPFDITLYFATADGTGLAPEVRTIQKSEGLARAAMGELIAGPSPGSGLLPTIPQGTSLLDINVTEDGLCIVDFSQELLGESSGEVIDDNLMVYSIVNTLTAFPTVECVQFRIDGETVETVGENISATAPLYPDSSLISQ